MTTETPSIPKLARGHFRCSACKSVTAAKHGDWYYSNGSSYQQVFLCKKCEATMKDIYKRAIPERG